MKWRQGVISKFVFNPNEPINQRELTALSIKIATRKRELEMKIRSELNELQQSSNLCLDQRRKLSETVTRAFVAFKQAELNEQMVDRPLRKASKFIFVCCAVLSIIGLMWTSETPARHTSENKPTGIEARSEKSAAEVQSVRPESDTSEEPPAKPYEPTPNDASTWESSLVRHLQRYKRYPSEALSRSEEGIVLLSFSIDRDGHVLARRIARSSGYADLDSEVMDMIMRAEPLPAFPANMSQAQLDLTIPIRFSMH
jgi:TonB family protein